MKKDYPSLKILIIEQRQFGYRNLTYYVSKLLNPDHEVTYCGWNDSKPEIVVNGVIKKEVSKKGNIIKRYIKFIRNAYHTARSEKYDLIHITYFPFSFILSILLNTENFLLDIRTGGVKSTRIRRIWYNIILRFDSLFYKNISIISSSLAKKLLFPKGRFHLLPLGANILQSNRNNFNNQIKLLYIGTLNNRNIETTIRGVKDFIDSEQTKPNLKYTIVGPGKSKFRQKVEQSICQLEVQEYVEYAGMVPHDQIPQYLEEYNVGISYIPQTKYFDCQPPTKTLEYLLAGLPVIATDTSENKILISEINGVLIKDTAESFCSALKHIQHTLSKYKPDSIRKSAENYSWEKIIYHNYLPYIQTLV